MRERLFQFLKLRRWTVYFESDQIDHREHLREQRADVLNVRENALGSGVSFAAETFVAVNGESVEKIPFLSRSFLDKPREPSFDNINFLRMYFKVRVKTYEV